MLFLLPTRHGYSWRVFWAWIRRKNPKSWPAALCGRQLISLCVENHEVHGVTLISNMIPVGKQDLVGWWDIHWFQGIFHLLDKWDLVGGIKINYKPWNWSLSPQPFFAMVLVTSPTRSLLLTTSNPLSWSSPQKMVYVLNSWLIPPISIILLPCISFISHGIYHKWYISFYLILYHFVIIATSHYIPFLSTQRDAKKWTARMAVLLFYPLLVFDLLSLHQDPISHS